MADLGTGEGAAFVHDNLGVARELIGGRHERYYLSYWGIGISAPLLAEKVPCAEAVSEGESGESAGYGQFSAEQYPPPPC